MNIMKHFSHPQCFPALYRAEHLLNTVSQLIEIILHSVLRNIRKFEIFVELHA